MQRTILEMLVLLVVGTTVAYAGNAFRQKHSIEWTRDYFKKSTVGVPEKPGSTESGVAQIAPAIPVVPAPASSNDATAQPKTATATAPEVKAHLDHDYQSIDIEGVKSALGDPRREQGLIVFVDARDDEPFEAGHIPGALQCDYYQLDKYIGPVLAKARVAEQVIVYCNGGQCEDSIYMCQTLLENGLDYNAVFLYEGGWKEWEKSGMPVAKGKEQP